MEWTNEVSTMNEHPSINIIPAELDPEFSTIKRARSLSETTTDHERNVRPRLESLDLEYDTSICDNDQNESYSSELKRSSTDDLLSNIENNLNYVNALIAQDDSFKLKPRAVSPVQSYMVNSTNETDAEKTTVPAQTNIDTRFDQSPIRGFNTYNKKENETSVGSLIIKKGIPRGSIYKFARDISKPTDDKIKSSSANVLASPSDKIIKMEDDFFSETTGLITDIQRSLDEDDTDNNEALNIISDIKKSVADFRRNKRFCSASTSFQNQTSSPKISDLEDYTNQDDLILENLNDLDLNLQNQPLSSRMADYLDKCVYINKYDDLDDWENELPDVSQALNSSSITKVARTAQRKRNKKKRTTLVTKLKKLQRELISKQRERFRKKIPWFKCKELDAIIVEKEEEIQMVRNELENIVEIKRSSSDSEEYEDEKNFGFGDDFENLLREVFEGNAATVQGLHDLKETLSRCPDEDEVAADPEGLIVPLMLHQKRALKWMLFREAEKKCPSGLLADDMGLGKTLTMISLILKQLPPEKLLSRRADVDSNDYWGEEPKLRADSRNISYGGGTLVVCPLSLLEQWQSEVANRTEKRLLSVRIYHGSNRKRDLNELCEFDIVITTYHILAMEYARWNTLFKISWERVVLDEAHIIRNPETSWSKAVCALQSEKRWALTGTPVHNRPLDLYSLLKFLKCSPWDDIRVWRNTMKKGKDGVQPLTTVLKSLVLRRTKKELQEKGEMPTLPPKIDKTIEIVLKEPQAEVYKTMLTFSKSMFEKFLLQRKRKAGIYDYDAEKRVHDAVKKNDPKLCNKHDLPADLFKELNKALLDGGKVKQFHILVLLLRLRQICNHPALLKKMIAEDEIEQKGNADGGENTNKEEGKLFSSSFLSENKDNPMRSDNPVFQPKYESAKIKAVFEILGQVLPTGDKIVIVSQWTSMLKIIEEHLLITKEAEWEMFSGEVDVKDRQDIVNRFNDLESDLKILLLSLTAGGVGLNLFGGNHLILFDNHWNPQLENQAQDRIYRYGQTKEVVIYRFLCTETIEERVKELQDEKLKLAKEIFTGLKLTSTRLTLNDLKRLFQMR